MLFICTCERNGGAAVSFPVSRAPEINRLLRLLVGFKVPERVLKTNLLGSKPIFREGRLFSIIISFSFLNIKY